MSTIPVKSLSRKPYLLMLQDESGAIAPVKPDVSLVNSNTALIVLDEYNDTCWIWVGRNVSMPTRMHALRMGKGAQKSGHKVKETNIGMALSKLVELMEKDDSDPAVASEISAFRAMLSKKWKIEDDYLAFDESKAAEYTVERPTIRETAVPSHERVARPEAKTAVAAPASRVTEKPASAGPPTPAPKSSVAVEHKLAFLLYSAVKNSDLIYTERFTRDGKMGVKIEVPGTMVIEAQVSGDQLVISPPNFGDSEEAKKVKAEYESWLKKI
ncbi:MAG: hypothetical protein HXY34_08715 [Candidatus Thorarchaeota archaeon]|nr:hypothetical protein [Candidatus Thorarchaeota archaeon]